MTDTTHPCPCGSGETFNACHGMADSVGGSAPSSTHASGEHAGRGSEIPTRHTWDPKHEAELDKLLALRAEVETAKVAALSPTEGARYQGLIGAVSDIGAILLIYIHGFDSIRKMDPARAGFHSHVLHWVHQNAGRSPRRIAGMTATNLCSILEDFIGEVASARLTPGHMQRLPRAFVDSVRPRGQNVREIKKAILRAVKPSVRADGRQWVSAIRSVFAVSLDPATEATLLSMISLRNTYVHEPGKVMTVNVTGEELAAWTKAVLVLAHDVALRSSS